MENKLNELNIRNAEKFFHVSPCILKFLFHLKIPRITSGHFRRQFFKLLILIYSRRSTFYRIFKHYSFSNLGAQQKNKELNIELVVQSPYCKRYIYVKMPPATKHHADLQSLLSKGILMMALIKADIFILDTWLKKNIYIYTKNTLYYFEWFNWISQKKMCNSMAVMVLTLLSQ